MRAKAIFLLTIVALLSFGSAGGDSAQPLPDSTHKTEDALRSCDVVFVGLLTELGDDETASSGVDTRGASIKVLEILRGSLGSDVVTAEINTVYFSTFHEQLPVSGQRYVFFIKKAVPRNIVLKLIPATDVNIGVVKKLVAQLPMK